MINNSMKSRRYFLHIVGLSITLLSLLLSGCEFSIGIGEQKEIAKTQTAIGSKQDQNNELIQDTTREAENATREFHETSMAEKEALESTLHAQQETISAQEAKLSPPSSNATQQLVSIADTETPTPETVAPILLTAWDIVSFFELPEGCMSHDYFCWKADDRGMSTGIKENQPTFRQDDFVDSPTNVTLTSKEAILIDPAWKTPHLVFWHQYEFFLAAQIVVKASGEPWAFLKTYNSGKLSDWTQESLDLSEYKGKSIVIQFLLVPHKKASSWLIEGIQIIPNFIPTY